LEGNPYKHTYKGKAKGKEKEEEVLEQWAVNQTERDEKRGWWRVWDISADCREIGGMECYGMSTFTLIIVLTCRWLSSSTHRAVCLA
jgi:hypothetical protein